jgi:hypothetical protein
MCSGCASSFAAAAYDAMRLAAHDLRALPQELFTFRLNPKGLREK